MTPQVSVIVPIYNLEFYLERCLDSLLAQDFDGPFEVLAVDDGSHDDSAEILRRYAKGRPGLVRAFRKPNGGHGSACNWGIERARGDFVLFLDGDDWLQPPVLREMHTRAVETCADLLIGNLLYHFDDRTEPFRPLMHIPTERTLEREDWSLLFKNWPTPCARLYRRRLFVDDPKLRFLEGVIHADANFAPKSYLAAQRIHYANREWYDYDLTRPTQSMKVTTKKLMDIVPALDDALDFYRVRGAFDRCRAELEHYTLAHVLGWVPRAGRLQDYPVGQAVRDLFGVMDRWFPGWLDGEAFAEQRPSRKSRLAMRVHHASGYETLLLKREVKAGLRAVLGEAREWAPRPAKGVERLRRLAERVVGDLDSAF